MIYLALLRGVNVGGNNKIDMRQLTSAFHEAGLRDILTYLNSGNVIFSSALDESAVKTICESAIAKNFGLSIAVAILTSHELADALANAPDWWGSAPGVKHNAIFVISPAKAQDVCAEVGEIKPAYERCACHGKLIFWSAPVETFSKTRWASVSKRATYQKITIRNANTAFKLADLIRKITPAPAQGGAPPPSPR